MPSEDNNVPSFTAESLTTSLLELQANGSSSVRAALEITGLCPDICVHCYAWDLRLMGSMDTGIADISLEAIQQAGFQEVYIVGGEPMKHPEVIKICKTAKEKGLKVILVTSGYNLWDEDTAKSILPVVDEIEISVRSSFPNEHDNIISGRLPDQAGTILKEGVTFEKAMRAFQVLQKLNTDGRVGLSVDHDLFMNDHYTGQETGMMWEIARYIVKDLGIPLKGFYGQLICPVGRAKQHNLPQIDKAYLLQELSDLRKIQVELGVTDTALIDSPVRLGIVQRVDEIPQEFSQLIAPETVPAINPRGEVRKNVVEI